jgi:hypothetical protein
MLDLIRQHEAEIKRRQIIERERLAGALAAAHEQASAKLAAAEAEGRCAGQAECAAQREAAEGEAADIVARARAEAASLQERGALGLEAAIEHVIAIVIREAP